MKLLDRSDLRETKILAGLDESHLEALTFMIDEAIAHELEEWVSETAPAIVQSSDGIALSEGIDGAFMQLVVPGLEEGLGPAVEGLDANYNEVRDDLRLVFFAMCTRLCVEAGVDPAVAAKVSH